MSNTRKRKQETSEGKNKKQASGFFGMVKGALGLEECKSDTSGLAGTMIKSNYGMLLRSHRNLPDLDVNAYQKLPCIVVVGAESHGKSSVLERIAMHSFFPRDEALCTRMPILLRLRNDATASDDTPVVLKLISTTKNGDENDELLKEEVTQEECGNRVLEIMQETVAEKNGAKNRRKPVGIVEDRQLIIEMRKPDVPTLDLIDLPGIVAGHKPGEPLDIDKQTERLAMNYCKENMPLILCVVAAPSENVRNERATLIVQKLQAQDRTICVLTKSDNVIEGEQNRRIVDRIKGTASDLPEGILSYVAVKNRSTESSLDIEKAAAEEQPWFESQKNLSHLDPNNQVTAKALITKLDDLLSNHIKVNWVPKSLSATRAHKKLLESRVAALGSRAGGKNLMQGVCDAILAEVAKFEAACVAVAKEAVPVVAPKANGEATLTPDGEAFDLSLSEKLESKNALRKRVANLTTVLTKQVAPIFENILGSKELPHKLARFHNLKAVVMQLWKNMVARGEEDAVALCDRAVQLHAWKVMDDATLAGALAESLFANIVRPCLDMFSSPAEFQKQLAAVLEDMEMEEEEMWEEDEAHTAQRAQLAEAMEKCEEAISALTALSE